MQLNDFGGPRRPEAIFQHYLGKFPSLQIYWYERTGRKQSRDKWEKQNVKFFHQLGKDNGFQCWDKRHQGEYHVDLCWYRGYPSKEAERRQEYWGKQEHCMELALEHEATMNVERMHLALSKLVDVKAYLKVLICKAGPIQRLRLPEASSNLIATSSIKVSTEAYLLIILSYDGTAGSSQAFRIDGFSIDYQGATVQLGSHFFPVRPAIV